MTRRTTRGTNLSVTTEDSEAAASSQSSARPGIDLTKLSSESKELFQCISQYFEGLMLEKDRIIKKLENDVSNLKDKIELIQNEIDDNAAYIRRETLIVSGNIPAGTHNEDCKSIVVNMMQQQLKLNLSPNDISVAHRVGFRKPQGPDRRSIVFKLCRRDMKYEILSACRQQRPNFFVNESLTSTRNRVLYILRRAKKKYPSKIKSLRSFEGSVTVYLSPVNRPTSENLPLSQLRRLTINTRKQLVGMLEKELQSTLEDLGLKWEGAVPGE